MIATLIIIIIVITIVLLANAFLKYSHKYFIELKPQTGTDPKINQGGARGWVIFQVRSFIYCEHYHSSKI